MGFLSRLKKRKEAPEPQRVILGFILFKGTCCNAGQFVERMREDWGITVLESPGCRDTLVFGVDEMTVTCAFIDSPIPNHEVEDCCRFNYMWPEARDTVSCHKSHLILSVVGCKAPVEGFKLFTKAAACWLATDDAIAIYLGNQTLVLPPQFYIDSAQQMEDGDLPVQLWVYFGLHRRPGGNCAYTFGLREFGREEVEVVDSDKQPDELLRFLCSVTGYLLGDDVRLFDGQTLNLSNRGPLPITLSEGVGVDGESLKIPY